MSEIKAYSLYEINKKIREIIESGFPELFWVVAEISEMNVNYRSGHCYLELIEKDDDKDNIIAKTRATIWASAYSKIQAYFETTTGQNLSPGIKVMVRVSIDYHEVYQLSLNIRDIDPSYTLGDLAKQRQQILDKLEATGTMDLNKTLDFPIVPQRIAVISSSTAAGFGDFIDQLENNPSGYQFYWDLYESTMQGRDTVTSLLRTFDMISEQTNRYDLVVVIRGGGSKIDLASFDNFDLGLYVAQFPIPVITGIGHDRDETIIDLVAHTSCKTPTAVAEFLIDQMEDFEAWLDEQSETITSVMREHILNNKEQLTRMIVSLPLKVQRCLEVSKTTLDISQQRALKITTRLVEHQKSHLQHLCQALQIGSKHFIQHQQVRNSHLSTRTNSTVTYRIKSAQQYLRSVSDIATMHDPKRLLKKGYSITYFEGKPVINATKLQPGDSITSRVNQGNIESTVKRKN